MITVKYAGGLSMSQTIQKKELAIPPTVIGGYVVSVMNNLSPTRHNNSLHRTEYSPRKSGQYRLTFKGVSDENG